MILRKIFIFLFLIHAMKMTFLAGGNSVNLWLAYIARSLSSIYRTILLLRVFCIDNKGVMLLTLERLWTVLLCQLCWFNLFCFNFGVYNLNLLADNIQCFSFFRAKKQCLIFKVNFAGYYLIFANLFLLRITSRFITSGKKTPKIF